MTNEKKIVEKFITSQDKLIIQASDLSLDTIATMVSKGHIDIEPEYQRRERWKVEAQSSLIESFLLNMPVPPIYLSKDNFGKYSIIDGKQRIIAISSYLQNKYALKKLDTFTEIEDCCFKQLPLELQNALRIRPYLRVITLLRQTDPELKYEVFTRLNKRGEPLNAQELRNVVFRGKLNAMIYELSESEFLLSQLKVKDKKYSAYQSMQNVEFVLRYFTLLESWQNFSGDLRKSMDLFMFKHKNIADSELEIYALKFDYAISTCAYIWGNNAFKRYDKSGWRDQALAGMFDAEMIAVSDYFK